MTETAVSPLWEPIHKYINELNGTRPMPAVYHYTSECGARGILNSGSLRFTERAHLNDETEISYGVGIAIEILKDRGLGNAAESLNTAAQTVFDEFQFFTACFCFEGDDPHLWQNYADGGKGVALGFQACFFDKPKAHIDWLFGGRNLTVFVCPMGYERDKLKDLITKIICAWDGQNINQLCDFVLMISSMFKEKCWDKEEEYRFFIHGRREFFAKNAEYYKCSECNGKKSNYLEIPIRDWPCKGDFAIFRMLVGPKAPSNLEKHLADVVISNKRPIHQDSITKSLLPCR
jgi:hypothetical protein